MILYVWRLPGLVCIDDINKLELECFNKKKMFMLIIIINILIEI